jgi:soluble lytic murein transglycosylase-like protein
VGKQTTPGAYISYSGPASNFPSDTDSWLTFDALWNLNLPALQYNDNADEIAAIKSGVSTVAGEAAAAGYPDINENYIFALIMQESAGNVNVPTTDNGVRNPGLLQSHNGVAYSGIPSITQMIHDGIMGTAYGDGILQCREQYGNIWAAARCYNSGSVDTANLSDGITSTGSYVSDVANRLRGATTS